MPTARRQAERPGAGADDGPLAPAEAAARGRARRRVAEVISVESITVHWHYLEAVANRALGRDLSSKSDPSDLAQQACLEAYQDFHKFSGTTNVELKFWLRRILINNVRNLARRYRASSCRDVRREISLDRLRSDSGDVPHPPERRSSAEGLAVEAEEIRRLRDALGRLPSLMHEILVWRSRDELTFRELGERLGCSSVAARKIWLRALAALRRELKEPAFGA